MRLVYFAWVRERIGCAEEDVDVPGEVKTVADLIAWQKTRGEEYEHAFSAGTLIRAAIDKVHAKPERPIAGANEIAFFPPMTGG
jgi:sulfur-carrier protein